MMFSLGLGGLGLGASGGGGGGGVEGPAADPIAIYEMLNGGVPTYTHPGGYISAARSTLTDGTLVTVQSGSPVIHIDAGGGWIEFPSSELSASVRIRLEDGALIPSGTRLRVEFEIFGAGNASIRPSIYNQNMSSSVSQRAEFSVDYTLTADIPASPSTNRYLMLTCSGGGVGTPHTGASVRNISVHLPPALPVKAHILAGQSNMHCNESGGWDTTYDRKHPRLETRPNVTATGFLSVDGTTKGATAPIQMSGTSLGLTPALAYMREHIKLDGSGATHRMLANAMGGTGLCDIAAAWRPGGTNPTQLNALAADIAAFLAEHPQNIIEAMLWCQGEADRGVNGASNYLAVFPTLVSYIRGLDARLADLPVIILSLNPYATDQDGYHAAMMAAQAQLDQDSGTAHAIPGVYYMPYDPAWGDQSVVDQVMGNVHMSSAINRVRGIAARQSAQARGVYA